MVMKCESSPILKKDSLYQELKRAISRGEYSTGYRFPPETEFAAQIGVSRNTLRTVFDRLESEQLLVRVKSKGTFVSHTNHEHAGRHILVLTLLDDDPVYTFHYIMPGINAIATEYGFTAELCDYNMFYSLTVTDLHNIIRAENLYGVIFIGSAFVGQEPVIDFLQKKNIPVVLVGGTFQDYQTTGWAAVVMDAQAAWRKGLEFLKEQGHKRVISCALRYPDLNIRQFPPGQYQKLLSEIGCDPTSDLIVYAQAKDDPEISIQIKRIFSSSNPPTAIMCYSDFWALAIYRTLKEMNLRIPEDVAIMGFGGVPDCKYLQPSLSTVDLEYEMQGRKAMEIIMNTKEWFSVPGQITQSPPLIASPYHLELRNSTTIQRLHR